MTLATIIETLKMIALKHPNVNSAYEGNIYEILNANPNNKYASVVITQQSHTTDEVYDHYGFVIFYVDRLVDDMEDNRVQIQSCGKSMLGNIITFFCEEFEAECDNITYQPFTQKFVDMTCGVYCTITIDIPKDIICPEEYWKEDWVTPVTVIRNQDKRVTFTENGTYTIDYDPTTYTGLGNVEVDVNIDVDSYYNNGYNQGKTDGVSEQKSKLETINITENGTYTKEDGYNHIEVNVPDLNGSYNEGYSQGKTDGVNEQKSKLETINITENGTYTKEDGYNHIEVNVPDLNGSYDEGKTDGVNEQKGKLTQIRITENGTYTKEDGYSEVVVDVPDLNGSYDEGYAQGKTDGANEQKSKLETISITENGTYTKEDGYNQIEVNVIPKINVKETGLNFAYSTFTEVPEWVDFEGITDMSYMFSNCYKLQTIPPLNTSNVTNMENMFDSCYELTSLPALNAQSLNMSPYNGVFGYNELPNLVNFGGFLNLKCSLITNKNLIRLPNLTYESCINILNGLYDFRGNGDNNTTSTLNVHQNFLDKVGDEISIGTSKGWTITV